MSSISNIMRQNVVVYNELQEKKSLVAPEYDDEEESAPSSSSSSCSTSSEPTSMPAGATIDQLFPDELCDIIGAYANEHWRTKPNATDPTEEASLLHNRAEESDALRDMLVAVDGDVSKLSPQQLQAIADHKQSVSHLNLTQMHISGEKLRAIIKQLTFSKDGKDQTALQSLVLTYKDINDVTLQTLADLFEQGLLPHLASLEINHLSKNRSCGCGMPSPPTAAGMKRLGESGLLAKLKQLVLSPHGRATNAPQFFPAELFCFCHALTSLKILDICTPEYLQSVFKTLRATEKLSQLQSLCLECKYTWEPEPTQILAVLADAALKPLPSQQALQLEHLGLGEFWTGPFKANVTNGHIKTIFNATKTIRVALGCMDREKQNYFSELVKEIDLSKVRNITIGYSQLLTDKLLQSIAEHMPHLTTLILKDYDPGYNGKADRRCTAPFTTAPFARLKNVKTLKLNGSYDNTLAYLLKDRFIATIVSSMPSLRRLQMPIAEKALTHISSFPELLRLQEIRVATVNNQKKYGVDVEQKLYTHEEFRNTFFTTLAASMTEPNSSSSSSSSTTKSVEY